VPTSASRGSTDQRDSVSADGDLIKSASSPIRGVCGHCHPRRTGESDLVRILREPKNASRASYQKLFEMESVHLKFTEAR